MSRKAPSKLLVGVDTGGTFTDIVYRDGGRWGSFKLLSTPDDPGHAVVMGLERLFGRRRPDLVTYGTTVATNAVLERRGARTALVTTRGFEDVLEIGRQARPQLYVLEPRRVEPLVPRRLRLGAAERVLYDGSVEQPLDEQSVHRLVDRIQALGVESVAVCLLHATANPEHERRLGEAFARLGLPVTLSHELSPVPGEFERSSTAAANAYVRPIVATHVERLEHRSRARRFRVMQSNGGAIGSRTASAEPVRTMLSGPAGGVAAAARCAAAIGDERAISFDMGGTSTDVALIDRAIALRTDTVVGGIPVRTPCVDIHTVGAGGGSIAFVDAGGSLKVGPRSAGADPGPACYGKGREPTVTDANLVLGRLRPDRFLGGSMSLDPARAHAALARLARDMAATTAEAAAEGIVEVVEANMERAIRVITVERGQDPRTCTLVAFGGAGGLHACGLADKLDISRILVPPEPGLLSAHGILEGPVVRDSSAALRMEAPTMDRLQRAARPLAASVTRQVAAEGIARNAIRLETFVRLRYLGQSVELEIPLTARFRRAFDEFHQRRFHHCDRGRPLEACGVRVSASGADHVRKPSAKHSRKRRTVRLARAVQRAVATVSGRGRRVAVHDRNELGAGHRVAGPAIVCEYSSTVFVAPGWRAHADGLHNLLVERSRG